MPQIIKFHESFVYVMIGIHSTKTNVIMNMLQDQDYSANRRAVELPRFASWSEESTPKRFHQM